MSGDFDPSDFEEARRNPREYMPNLTKFIHKSERGYHAVIRGRVASLVAMTVAALEDFELFDDWRQEKCHEDDTKLLSLTEENFQPHAARCVVTLACFGSDILPSTRSKCLTVVKALVEKGVAPEECAELIKTSGGFETVYQEAKEERARHKDRGTRPKQSAKSRASDKAAGKSKKSHAADLVQKGADDSHAAQLWINLEEDELEDFLDNAEEGEIRLLRVECAGRLRRNGPMIWSLLKYEVLEADTLDDDGE